ncbi:hypothetical protein N9V90_02295 [Endozoicomonas sp.]|nr:hypothetical protein [Endozoicomonas sp.]
MTDNDCEWADRFMDESNLNGDSESASDKMSYLEEANQAAIKEMYRLQILVEKKEDEVSDLSKLNEALLEQVEEKNKVIIEHDVQEQSAEIMRYLEEANQSAIKEIDRLQVQLAEQAESLNDVFQLNEALFVQVEEKNILLFDLEDRILELQAEKEDLLVIQKESEDDKSYQYSEKKQYTEKLKTSIAVSEKQIDVLKRLVLAHQ